MASLSRVVGVLGVSCMVLVGTAHAADPAGAGNPTSAGSGNPAAAGSGAAPATAAANAAPDASGNPAAVTSDDGKFADKDGNPTFKIDGKKVDYYTFAGYVRYTANCMQCHGPEGLGSSYAPSLVNALHTVSYGDFLGIVAGGKKNVDASQQLVMPALGENKNVMCYLDAIYVYLRARSDGAVERGRPAEHANKPDSFAKNEDACMG